MGIGFAVFIVEATPSDARLRLTKYFNGIPYSWTFRGETDFTCYAPGYTEVWLEAPPVDVEIQVIPMAEVEDQI